MSIIFRLSLMKINFTQQRINSLCNNTNKQIYCYDNNKNGNGLGIRIGKNKKSYFYQYRFKSKVYRIPLGDCNAISYQKVLELVSKEKFQITQGHNPIIVKKANIADSERKKSEFAKAQIEKQKKIFTIGQLWMEFVEYKKNQPNKRNQQTGLSTKHIKSLIDAIKPNYPIHPLADIKINDLDKEIVSNWLTKQNKRQKPAFTSLHFRYLKTFINWLNHSKDIDKTAIINNQTIKENLPMIRPKKQDCLSKEQLPMWFSEVQKLSPIFNTYLQTLILTGARRNEIAKIKWNDVNFKWKTITISDKVQGERVIPLTNYLAYLFAQLPKKNDYVFYSNSELGYLVEPTKAHRLACKSAGIDLTIHGLRRTFITLSEYVEAPSGLVRQICGHRPNSTAEKHYINRPIDLLRTWLDKIQMFILDTAQIKQTEDNKLLQKVS